MSLCLFVLHAFCHVCSLQIFFLKKHLLKNFRMSPSLEPDHVRRFADPDLGPNCLQTLSEDDEGGR